MLLDLTEIQCGIRESLSGYGIWPKYRAGFGKRYRGHGIWLLPEQRDSIKFGNGCEIGKENDIGDVTEVQDPLFQTLV